MDAPQIEMPGVKTGSVVRLSIGILGTLGWLGTVYFFYLEPRAGVQGVLGLTENNFGDFLAGVFAPLAFFWFVLAYLQQSAELKLQREEVSRLASETAAQRKAIEANELHARRDTFVNIYNIALELQTSAATRLIWHLHNHWSSSIPLDTDEDLMAPTFDGQPWAPYQLNDHMSSLRTRYSNGERHVFFDDCIVALKRVRRSRHLLTNVEICRLEAQRFVERFEWLVELAQRLNSAPVGIEVPDSLERGFLTSITNGPMASLYSALCVRYSVQMHCLEEQRERQLVGACDMEIRKPLCRANQPGKA